MLILQYILNLGPNTVYTYKGSGTIVISGTAPVVFNPVFELFLQRFKVGEYVYDSEHTVWQIAAIQGEPDNPTYVAQKNGKIKSFYGNQITKFTNENQVFELIYQKNINAYEYNIQVLAQIENNLPSTVPETNDYLFLKNAINGDFGNNDNYDNNIIKYNDIIIALNQIENNLPSNTPETNDYLYLKTAINGDFGSNDQYDANIAKYNKIINTLNELYNN
jgi:hypothetical protein